MEEKNEKLFIGDNTPASRATDYVAGFGRKELFITLIAGFISLIGAFIVYANTGQVIYAMAEAVGVVMFVMFLIYRNKYDESMIDQLKLVIRYLEAQKRYEYEYYNIYEEEEIE